MSTSSAPPVGGHNVKARGRGDCGSTCRRAKSLPDDRARTGSAPAGRRPETVDGVLVIMPTPSHQARIARRRKRLAEFILRRSAVVAGCSPAYQTGAGARERRLNPRDRAGIKVCGITGPRPD